MVTIKGNEYTIKTLPFDMGKALEKNGKFILVIPEESEEDFIQILSYAGAAAKLIDKPETTLQTDKTN